MNIRFIVDSACDIPQPLIERHQMTVLPTYVNVGGISHADNAHFDRKRFYTELADMHPPPQTAAPAPGEAKALIHEVFATADHLVLVSIASKLSAVHNAMRLGIEGLPPERVTLIDSEQLSMGAGFQAIIGAEVAQQTGDIAAVVDAVSRVRNNQTVYAAMETLSYVQRSGRVNWAVGTVGNMLRIRPIVEVLGGEINSVARVRRHGAWVDKVEAFIRQNAPLDRVAFLHTNNLEDITTLQYRLQDVLPENTMTVLASPTIGTHTGPNGIGAAVVRRAWRS